MSRRLDHEKLGVYQAALTFITWLESILRNVPKSLAVGDQLWRIVSMLVALIKANSSYRLHDQRLGGENDG